MQAQEISTATRTRRKKIKGQKELRFADFSCRIRSHPPYGDILMAENRETARKAAKIETNMSMQGREGKLRDLLRDHPQTKTIRRVYRQESKHIPTRVRAGCAS